MIKITTDLVPTSHVQHLDFFGADIDVATNVESWEDCARLCYETVYCQKWTYHDETTPLTKLRRGCFMKSDKEVTQKPCSYCISGKLTGKILEMILLMYDFWKNIDLHEKVYYKCKKHHIHNLETNLFVSDIDVSIQMLSGAPSGFINQDLNEGLHSLFRNW